MLERTAAVVYSLVIPLYNEEAVLPLLLHRLDRLLAALDAPAEVILVDDGSRDTTGIVAAAKAKGDPRYRYLALSRNFGHQVAISAGMDFAAGEAIVVMDADLQRPAGSRPRRWPPNGAEGLRDRLRAPPHARRARPGSSAGPRRSSTS